MTSPKTQKHQAASTTRQSEIGQVTGWRSLGGQTRPCALSASVCCKVSTRPTASSSIPACAMASTAEARSTQYHTMLLKQCIGLCRHSACLDDRGGLRGPWWTERLHTPVPSPVKAPASHPDNFLHVRLSLKSKKQTTCGRDVTAYANEHEARLSPRVIA